jgi:phage/plasmid-associated DNA primase
MECNEKPKLSEVNNDMSRRIIDIPFESTFIDKQNYNKLTKDEIIDSKYF